MALRQGKWQLHFDNCSASPDVPKLEFTMNQLLQWVDQIMEQHLQHYRWYRRDGRRKRQNGSTIISHIDTRISRRIYHLTLKRRLSSQRCWYIHSLRPIRTAGQSQLCADIFSRVRRPFCQWSCKHCVQQWFRLDGREPIRTRNRSQHGARPFARRSLSYVAYTPNCSAFHLLHPTMWWTYTKYMAGGNQNGIVSTIK